MVELPLEEGAALRAWARLEVAVQRGRLDEQGQAILKAHAGHSIDFRPLSVRRSL
ncbi:MAG: hypothetical protein ACI9DC_003025 [Gammaproteobacteria bacterium]|jgi:hypothetical protein